MKPIQKYSLLVASILLIAAAVFLGSQKKPHDAVSHTSKELTKPPGACAPNTAACKGNPELCMETGKNAVCE